jgi:hypothetical protein
MINNKRLNLIVSRLNKINDQYKQPLPSKSLEKIRNITPLLSEDFITLNNFCRCDFFRSFEFYNFENEEGVIEETLGLRQTWGLPNNYLVLAMDDAGPTLLKINSPENSEVILCSYYDLENICAGKTFEENPIIYNSFTDFYEFLLDEEEKRRAEKESDE